MALTDSNVLKLAPDAATPAYRSAPHNIEAEQSLLGAILVNNDAFYRVSDFLEPKHYFEPLHQTIYETAGSLIRMGKVATPVTLKTFLPADTDIESVRRKLSYDLYYVRRHDPGLDLRLIVCTAFSAGPALS